LHLLSETADYGNRYSGFYYKKEYHISLSHAKNIHSADKVTAKTAQGFILHSLSIRDRETDDETINSLITSYLQEQQHNAKVYPYLRRIFGQQGGPTISTLLSALPYDYLNLIQMTLGYYASETEQQNPDLNSKKNPFHLAKNTENRKTKTTKQNQHSYELTGDQT